MPIINVSSTLEYNVATPTTFVFSVVPAETSHQRILQENLVLSPDLDYEWLNVGKENMRNIRLQANPGSFQLDYQATVELSPDVDHAPMIDEVSYQTLPAEVLDYLNPSRYCESDRLALFAQKEFGAHLTGYSRVEAICDWVHNQVDYVSGSTDASSSACDVLINRAGVCRDFAHTSIALCRALGIPARYISGYAVDLQPPDFHGFFEAYLQGKWYMFDATRMAPLSGFVRIGLGRDAADASFATIVGSATLENMQVSAVVDAGSTGNEAPNDAISTS
ncbi:transglutaminase-like domain-containing protein [Leucothrix arctica]|uniref:Transglutaminase family protein n=1 Tax=Leucothrix arctica TaxID=1481894 RepID=A0A317CD02_9GAMM|nr:transglutaminase family protein [Leucothrix arctica]PWQ96514.1 transglutaminase family protein [Leucothrix arctica]